MLPINPTAVYIKSEAREDPRSMARIERMLPFMHFDGDPVVLDDAALEQVIIDENLTAMPRHGREGQQVEPVVIFNQFF